MSDIYENLNDLLTTYRDNALRELKLNELYAEWQRKKADLQSELKEHLTPDAKAIFEDYTESALAVMTIECNELLISGLVFQSTILKCLDANTPEHQALVKSFVKI